MPRLAQTRPRRGAGAEPRRNGGLDVRVPGDVDHDARVVADDPRIVPGRHVEAVARAVFKLAPVIHADRHPPLQNAASVAAMLLKKEAVITDIPEAEKVLVRGGGGGGMGGMY